MTAPSDKHDDAWLIRASGEGTAHYLLCRTMQEVRAAYVELVCGTDDEHHRDEIDAFIETFADPDEWCMGGFKYELYCGLVEVWVVPRSVVTPSAGGNIEAMRAALKPFAEIGAWLFARPEVPDSEPLVDVHHLNNARSALTRGDFKAAHTALQCAPSHALRREPAEPVRDEVARFAVLMERKLKANDHKDHWPDCGMSYLLKRLREELVELEGLLLATSTPWQDEVAGEAADVANFAMMIADNFGALPTGPLTRSATLPSEAAELLRAAREALHSSYDVQAYPGDGKTVQDGVIARIDRYLATPERTVTK